MLELLLLPETRQAIAEQDWAEVTEIADSHPVIAAEAIESIDDGDLRAAVLQHLPLDIRVAVVEHLSEEIQDDLVERLADPDVAQLLERMSHDDRADLVKRMEPERWQRLFRILDPADRNDIQRLLGYEEGTVGSIMTTDYVAFRSDFRVKDAIERIRSIASERETIYVTYITDSMNRLIGVVSLRDLLLSPDERTLDEIMNDHVLSLSVTEDINLAARAWADHDLLAWPVVDEDRRLIGIVTHDDIFDILEDVHTEEAQRMGAVEPLENDYFSTSFWTRFRKRVVWLWVLFIAELGTSYVLEWNVSLLTQFTVLVIFMPVITATGGNSGSQAASLITRALALSEVEPQDWPRIAVREFLSGIALGAAVGALSLVVLFIRGDELPLMAYVLVGGLVAVTTVGSMVGALMPLVFQRVGIDPAYSSSPFVASTVDVLGLAVYLGIASMVLVRS